MSTTTPNDPATPQSTRTEQALQSPLELLRATPVPAPVEALAFWAAIALPFLLVALLVGPGLDSPAALPQLVGLLAANVVALAVGQGHRPD